MRKVILYTAASMDGYIAGRGGALDWLEKTPNHGGNDYGYHAFYSGIDTTLMGNKTYEAVMGFDLPWPYEGKTNYVFSRTAKTSSDQVSFVSGGIAAFVSELKSQPGKDIWLVGGGQINTILLNAGLIDALIISRIPVVLGGGTPLFAGSAEEAWFDLKKTEDFNSGVVQLTYASR